MKFICSLIVVEDVEKSKNFYEKILKQSVATDFGENVAFVGGFAIHKRDHFQSLISNETIKLRSNNFELYFEDDDLEAIEEELKQEGLEFIHGIKEQPWKQLVLRFYDYDKNIIEIGERMEHVAFRLSKENMTIEEIANITYLSHESVVSAIEMYTKN